MAKMDREEAAAYLHDSTPWAEMSDAHRQAWQKRAAVLIDQGYTHADLGQFQGVGRSTISEHLGWSPADSETDRDRRERETAKRQVRQFKQVARENTAAADLFVEAVGVDAAIDAVSKAAGATRTAGPKANAEDIFGPFVKLRNAAGNLRRILPDFTPGADIADEAQDTISDLEGTTEIIRAWLKGSDVADEVEAFLKGATG